MNDDEKYNSPFPGMDPYLESRWPEVHARLIVYSCNQLNDQLPDDLQANIEENLSVRYQNGSEERAIRPDINVSWPDRPASAGTESGTATVELAVPTVMRLAPHPHRHVEIVDSNGRVITVIEFISPWNKVGSKNRENYARKQLDYQTAGVNLVEIDLVRQGKYVLMAPIEKVRREMFDEYKVCVYRSSDPDQVEWYRAPITAPLPNIPVPLRPDERPAVMQLQPLIDACYRDGRYYLLDYAVPPEQPWNKSTMAWIDSRLRESGRRG